MIYACGVDVGSTQTKAVVLDESRKVVGTALISTGANVIKAAEKAFPIAVAAAKIRPQDVAHVVGTGYGRYKVTFGQSQITEIACHAKGAHAAFPKTKTVVDMGGQDTKIIRIGDAGEVIDFSMNDKCAAGTGRFLASAADVAGVDLSEIGPLALKGKKPVRLTTVCTVFVESDIMSYLAQGKKLEDVMAGVHRAIAARTVSLAARVGVEEEVTFTGGVTKNIGMVRALEEKLGCRINVSPEGHFTGALGGALFALEKALWKESSPLST